MSKDNNEENVADGYVKIEIPGKGEESSQEVEDVNLEDITEGEPEQQEEEEVKDNNEDDTDVTSTDDEDKSKSTKKEEKPKSKKPKSKRPSRAKERIKELHAGKTAAEQRAAALEAELEELRRAQTKGSVESQESMKESIENNLSNLSKALKEALEDGDSEEAVRLQDEMITSKMKLAALEHQIQQGRSKVEQDEARAKSKPKQNQQDTQANQIPEKALEWIEEYPEFTTDELFHVAARTVNNQLINEGMDPEDEEFYEELNERLAPRFPEVFGIDDKNGVNYNKNTSNQDEDGNNDSDNDEVEDEVKVQQTVSGASRTPPHKKGKGRSNDSVVLDPQTVKQAERWGLSLEQIARRVAHNSKNRKDDGYVPIKIKRS